MIKRPLNPQFTKAVLEGRKVSTIRRTAWPVGVPIILYNWSGKPYRSKQKDVAVIVAFLAVPVIIHHRADGFIAIETARGSMIPNLWIDEGFNTLNAFDEWFRRAIPNGAKIEQYLMRFKLK